MKDAPALRFPALSAPALRFAGVCFSQGDKRVLRDISFEISVGESVAIVGRNGSGKSTLARHMNALLVPDEGIVEVFGRNTSDVTALGDIRRSVGMMFQDPESQIVATTVGDDVAFGLENIGIEADEMERRIAASLSAVGLSGYAEKDAGYLSGGEKQRLALASILAMEPRVIVLDEASAMLDPDGRSRVRAIVQGLSAHGMTVVSVTHFMDEALAADRVIALRAGTIAYDGDPAGLFANRKLVEDLGLELPFEVELADELRKLGIEIPWTAGRGSLVEALKGAHAKTREEIADPVREPNSGLPKDAHAKNAQEEMPPEVPCP